MPLRDRCQRSDACPLLSAPQTGQVSCSASPATVEIGRPSASARAQSFFHHMKDSRNAPASRKEAGALASSEAKERVQQLLEALLAARC